MTRAATLCAIIVFEVALAACASRVQRNAEKGPHGTIAYSILIESSEPGARVEANDEYLGVTPIKLKIFGDKDGTFHNFGRDRYVIRVYPTRAGELVQTKTFNTGGRFAFDRNPWGPEDTIPKRLYFDLSQNIDQGTAGQGSRKGFTIDLPARSDKQQ